MKYNGIIISDIHFGVIDPIIMRKELLETFIYYLDNMKKIDFIVITGDYFDHKLYVNEKTTDCALAFMDRLVMISKKHNCPLRIVYGTESHEVDQYSLFSIYETDPSINFKIIRNVSEEELLKDLHVLYLPEEFVLNKEEYYKEFFEKKNEYDYIFGHGVIQEVMTEATRPASKEKENTRKKVPYFKTIELDKICKGQVYFGHYHVNTNIQDKIFYVGSFTRFQYGEEEPKGFYHVKCDTEKEKYSNTFIENQLAKKYVTYTYSYNSDVMNTEESLMTELTKVDKLIDTFEYDHVRYIFNIPENHPNPEFVINILNERYKYNDNVKVKITNGYIEKKKRIKNESMSEVFDEYPMIFDKCASLEDKVVYYIKKKWNKEITVDKVKRYLYGNNE